MRGNKSIPVVSTAFSCLVILEEHLIYEIEGRELVSRHAFLSHFHFAISPKYYCPYLVFSTSRLSVDVTFTYGIVLSVAYNIMQSVTC